MNNNPCIYILTNKRNGTIYTGVTNNLCKRILEHKNKIHKGFTNKYSTNILVYYETCPSIEEAIIREKQIKAGSRKKKLLLIEKDNPGWNELFEDLCGNQ